MPFAIFWNIKMSISYSKIFVNEFHRHAGCILYKHTRKFEDRAKANSCQNISRSIGTDYIHTKGGICEVIYKVTMTARR